MDRHSTCAEEGGASGARALVLIGECVVLQGGGCRGVRGGSGGHPDWQNALAELRRSGAVSALGKVRLKIASRPHLQTFSLLWKHDVHVITHASSATPSPRIAQQKAQISTEKREIQQSVSRGR